MTRRLLPLCLMAALLSACGEEFSVATVAYLPSPPLPREMLTVTMNDPWRSHTLNGSQIAPPGQASAEYPTGEFGPLRFAFRFANGAVVASEGELEVQLGKNVRYDFVIQVAPANPTTACVDCGKAIGFALAPAYRTSAGDSVWVRWAQYYTGSSAR